MISVSYFFYLLENENYSYHVLKLRSTVKIKADYCDLSILYLFFACSSHGGHSTTGDFDSEVDSTVSSRRGSRRREKHSINRNEGEFAELDKTGQTYMLIYRARM